MRLHPAWNTLLRPKGPRIKLLDVREDVSDLTTYTFTGCNIPLVGAAGQPGAETYGTNALLRASSRDGIVMFVHGEDAATVFDVSSVTIGGVAGSEQVDRAGATVALNTAMYTWRGSILNGISNTDVVVTWSEAITACAIGILLVENGSNISSQANGSSQSTGNIVVRPNFTIATGDGIHTAMVMGMTCATGGGTELPQFGISGAGGNHYPTMLYQGSNAEMDYAAAWAPLSQWHGGSAQEIANIVGTWSGAGNGDAVGGVLF